MRWNRNIPEQACRRIHTGRRLNRRNTPTSGSVREPCRRTPTAPRQETAGTLGEQAADDAAAADDTPGGYPNLLGRDDPRAALSYGPNSARLAELKCRYDPHNLFRSATALPRLA
jgi:hypothetical protein